MSSVGSVAVAEDLYMHLDATVFDSLYQRNAACVLCAANVQHHPLGGITIVEVAHEGTTGREVYGKITTVQPITHTHNMVHFVNLGRTWKMRDEREAHASAG